MESALTAFSSGQVIQSVRNMITIEEGRRYLGVMPAAMGLKLVSFYPGNSGTAHPTHLAMIMLFSPDTGEPLAVMDGRLIAEMRTAAVSAAVTKRLAAPESRSSPSSAAGCRPRRIWRRSPRCVASTR
jgi:thiomorpholine-carboxylate dehydrogenase